MAEKGAKWEAAKENLINQGKELPEVLLTGFLSGLFMGIIQRVVQHQEFKSFKIKDQQSLENWADKYVKEHHLPIPRCYL